MSRDVASRESGNVLPHSKPTHLIGSLFPSIIRSQFRFGWKLSRSISGDAASSEISRLRRLRRAMKVGGQKSVFAAVVDVDPFDCAQDKP